MSHGKKSKRKKHKHRPGHENPKGGDKLDSKSDRVIVSGKIEANFSPNLVEKYDLAGYKQESWDRKKFKAEIVTIVLLFAYTTVAFWQGLSNNRAAKAAKLAAEATVKQLQNFEIVQGPRLTFEEFQATIIPGTDFIVDVT